MRSNLWVWVGACVSVMLLDCSNEDCREVKYCKIYDVLGACTEDTCTFKGVELHAIPTVPLGPEALSYAAVSTWGPTEVAEIAVDLATLAERPTGLDPLVIAFEPSVETSLLKVELSNGQTAACECDCRGTYTLKWTCDAAAVGDAQLRLSIGPGVRYKQEVKIFYRQTECTSVFTLCGSG